MKNGKNQQVTIGGALILRENRGKRQFLLCKNKDQADWEVPKVTVRKGESSVRSVIRLTGEQGGMAARVLEEAGRASGNITVNGKVIPQKFYYYLMYNKNGSSELLGFDEVKWFEYADAVKKVPTKREKEMLKGGRDVLKEWEKTHNLKKHEVEDLQ
jgi:8-oxo-dGTP pyrophosphatase MutT (NUDIX family)